MTRRNETVRPAALVAVLVLVAIACLFLVQTYGKAYRESGNDFTSYLLSAEALVDGGNPYETASPFPYVYPAFLAAALVPLTWIPYWLSVLLWYVASVAALCFAVRITVSSCSRRIGASQELRLAVPLAVSAVLLLSPIQNNLLNGQVNFVVLLLCVLFVADLDSDRPNRAAVWLALATAIKLTPAIFLLYLLGRRRFGTALLCVALAAVFFFVPALFAGPELIGRQVDQARSLSASALHPPEFPGGYPPFNLSGVVGSLVPQLRGSMVLLLGSVLLVLGLLVWNDRRTPAGGDAVTAQLYLLGMLLIAPWSEKHHLAFLMPAAIVASLALTRDPGWMTRTAGRWLAIFWGALVLGSRMTTLPLHFVAIAVLFFLLATLPGSAGKAVPPSPSIQT